MLTAATMALVMVTPVAGFMAGRGAKAAEIAAVARVLDQAPDCFGANAMLDAACSATPLGGELYPGLAAVKADTTVAYNCYNDTPQNGRVLSCGYGSDDADALRVAVTGDSHGAMIVAGLHPYLDELDWRIDTFVSRGCTWASPSLDDDCREYRENLGEELLDGGYDVVLTTAVRNAQASEREVQEFAAARAAAWRPLLDAGIDVAVIADNPRVPDQLVDCVAMNAEEAVAGRACTFPVTQLRSPVDSGPIAVELEPRAVLIDTADLFCNPDGCPMVIGNVNVYRDQHHVTSTYIRTAAPHLAERVRQAIGRSS
jgi:hypothetical protein